MRDYRGGRWSAEPTLDDYISLDERMATEVDFGGEGTPQLAMRDNGDTLIEWSQFDANGDEDMRLFISEYRN